jgi:hypothetical protein
VEFTGKKLGILAGVALGLVILPVLLLCNGAMNAYQARIDGNPGSGFNRWLQLATADACAKTWRPEMAAERYRKFMEHYPSHERRPYALLQLARALEEGGRTVDARKTYARFMEEYPDRPEDRRECEVAIDRITHTPTK